MWAEATAVCTAVLAFATICLASVSMTNIWQVKNMYEKDNRPNLLFDFDLDNDSFKEHLDMTGEHGRHPYFEIVGSLINPSKVSAIDCSFNIYDKERQYPAFEVDVMIASALQASSTSPVKKTIDMFDILKITNSKRAFLGISQALADSREPDGLSSKIIAFLYKSNNGEKHYTIYRFQYYTTGENQSEKRKAHFLGSGNGQITKDIIKKAVQEQTIRNSSPL